MGRLRFIPKMLALRAVQRHTAASRSTRPFRREQHGVTGGWPKVIFNKPFRTLPHTPSLSASRGHEPVLLPPEGVEPPEGPEGPEGYEPPEGLEPPGLEPPEWFGLGVCFGLGLGFGYWPEPQVPQDETSVKKRMLIVRKIAREEQVLEAILVKLL
ncbi:unnamed protein product [Lathyrus sativus]|nr:unnamed protein product [Lathyrus sativus]